MSAPAADPLPLAAWTVLIAKAAALGLITPDHPRLSPHPHTYNGQSGEHL